MNELSKPKLDIMTSFLTTKIICLLIRCKYPATISNVSFIFTENTADLPDPFVKIVLLPDRPKKRKTDYCRETTCPAWEESFEYSIPRGEVRDKELELVVVDRKGLFSR